MPCKWAGAPIREKRWKTCRRYVDTLFDDESQASRDLAREYFLLPAVDIL